MRSWNLLIQVFALANLVIGTGGFMLTGFLEPLASSLQVSVAAAGQAITVYALACALIAPLLILATGRWSRKNAILLGLALFTLGGALSALASSLPVLLAGRALMGAGSMFSALAAAVVVALSPPSQRGRALSLVMLGVGLSYAIGVPLGAWMGWVYGWQVPVWAVTAACAVMGLFLLAALPAQLPAPGVSFTGLAAAARQAPVLRIGARTLLNFIAIFCVFSYIEGEVQWVGTDAVQDPKLGPVYPVRIKLHAQHTPHSVNSVRGQVTPGMTVVADVRTDSRRLIEYFLAPMLRYQQEALRER